MEEFTDKIRAIVRSHRIKHPISDVIIDDAGLKGEGFVSLTQFVTVKFCNDENEKEVKPLNLFVKTCTDNASHSQLLEEMKAFEKEATFFMEYVKEAEEMCKQKGRDGFMDFYPKCYFGDKTMTVLENLVLDKGYEMLKNERQDFEAATFAMKTLAKHHAISYIMIQENGGAKNFMEKFPILAHESYSHDNSFIVGMMEPLFENAITSDVKILEKSKIPGSEETAAKLKTFSRKPMGIIIDTVNKKDADNSLYLLGHGDYWNNNMMFLKDKESSRIMHHVAIDFQVTRFNSMAIDLSYYLFSSVQPTVRQNRLHELLEVYRNTFNNATLDFGHPVNLTVDKLFLEYRKKFEFGFWMGFIMAVGPAMTIFRNVDISKVDVKDWVAVSGGLVNKWIDENPDKATEVAEELVKLFKEYDDLVLVVDN